MNPTVEKDAGDDALAPLRAALLAHARAAADGVIARADAEAAGVIDKARAETDAQLAEARARGAADARARLRSEHGRLQRDSRRALLRAQRWAYDELVHTSTDTVRRLLADPATQDRLARGLRDRLGGDVVIGATPDGGLCARRPDGKAIEASVDVLVAQAVARLDLEDLWAPDG